MSAAPEVDATARGFYVSHIPKKETQVEKFLENSPQCDGRDILIAIWDTGVDPDAEGLQITTTGERKIVGLYDATGCGDVDCSFVATLDANWCIKDQKLRTVQIPTKWKPKYNHIHVGWKLLYDLVPHTVSQRITDEWTEKKLKPVINKIEFEEMHERAKILKLDSSANVEAAKNLVNARQEDFEGRDRFLASCLKTKIPFMGPICNFYVFQDTTQSDEWVAAIDTSSYHGKQLSDIRLLRNFSISGDYHHFDCNEMLHFAVNISSDGNQLELVTVSGAHGTHVAGIASGYNPKNPSRNGIAPGAQIVSIMVGNTLLNSMETGAAIARAVAKTIELKCDLVNFSFGEPSIAPAFGYVTKLISEMVLRYGIIMCNSAGNHGPALSTVGAPASSCNDIISVAAVVFSDMAVDAYSLRDKDSSRFSSAQPYTWSSRGPTEDGALGVTVAGPGGAIAPVSKHTLKNHDLMNGTSMSSPNVCGCVALILSAMRQRLPRLPRTPFMIRFALTNSATYCHTIDTTYHSALTEGHGLVQVQRCFDLLSRMAERYPAAFGDLSTPSSTSDSTDCDHRSDWQRGGDVTSANLFEHFGVRLTLTDNKRGVYLRHCGNGPLRIVKRACIKPHFSTDTLTNHQLSLISLPLLISCDAPWVSVPSRMYLQNEERVFDFEINLSGLTPNNVYFTFIEVYHSENTEFGPLARLPVTVVMPERWDSSDYVLHKQFTFTRELKIMRLFLDLPPTCNGVEVSICCEPGVVAERVVSEAALDNTFYHIAGQQVHPFMSYASCSEATRVWLPCNATYYRQQGSNASSSPHEIYRNVYANHCTGMNSLWEFCVAQSWRGSASITEHTLSFTVSLLGLVTVPREVTLISDGRVNEIRNIRIMSTIRAEDIQPTVNFRRVHYALRPITFTVQNRSPTDTGKPDLPPDLFLFQLVLTYSVKLNKTADVTFDVPLFSRLLYDCPVLEQQWYLRNADSRLIASGDYRSLEQYFSKLPKGQCWLTLVITHHNRTMLREMATKCGVVVYMVVNVTEAIANGFSPPSTSEFYICQGEPMVVDSIIGSRPSASNTFRRLLKPGECTVLSLTGRLTEKDNIELRNYAFIEGSISLYFNNFYSKKLSIPFRLVNSCVLATEPIAALKGFLKNFPAYEVNPIFDKFRAVIGTNSESLGSDAPAFGEETPGVTSSTMEFFDGLQLPAVDTDPPASSEMSAAAIQSGPFDNAIKCAPFQARLLKAVLDHISGMAVRERESARGILRSVYGCDDENLHLVSTELRCIVTDAKKPSAANIAHFLTLLDKLDREDLRNYLLCKTQTKAHIPLSVYKGMDLSSRCKLYSGLLIETGKAICQILIRAQICTEAVDESRDVVESESDLQKHLQTIFVELCCLYDYKSLQNCDHDLLEFWFLYALLDKRYGRCLDILNHVPYNFSSAFWLETLLEYLHWSELTEIFQKYHLTRFATDTSTNNTSSSS